MPETVPKNDRPCAFPGCPVAATVQPGSHCYPFCSSSCRSRAAELSESQVNLRAARAGQYVSHPCRGGGAIRRRLALDSLVVQQGETVIIIEVTAIENALAAIGHRAPKPTNGHAR